MENAASALGLTSLAFPDGLARTMSPACGNDWPFFFAELIYNLPVVARRTRCRRGESGAEPSLNLDAVVRLLAKTGFVQAGLSQLAPPMVTGP